MTEKWVSPIRKGAPGRWNLRYVEPGESTAAVSWEWELWSAGWCEARKGERAFPFSNMERHRKALVHTQRTNWERVLLTEDSEILKKMVLEKLDNVQTGYYSVARIAHNSVSGSWPWASVLFLRQPGALSPNAWLSHLLAKIKNEIVFGMLLKKRIQKWLLGLDQHCGRRKLPFAEVGRRDSFLKCLILYFDEYDMSSGKCVPGRQISTSGVHWRREVETWLYGSLRTANLDSVSGIT